MEPITAADYFAQAGQRVLLDVRSPGEYTAGHLPGAVSLPLFSDAERAEVGTLYKQESPDAALLRGLDIAGGKMRQLVESAREAAPEGRVTVYCWRGGQRSASVGWLLERAGMKVQQLIGGYKSYRTYVRNWLAEDRHQLTVLSGPTGSGKTAILRALSAVGAHTLDLEGLARHKGSSFGALGEAPQPSTEEFENLLFAALRKIPSEVRVWVEDESRMIGTVCQPQPFYQRLTSAPVVLLEQPLEWRIENLVRDYADFPLEELREAFARIKKKLGGQHLNTALEALDREDYAAAARIALGYYDKAYAHYAERRQPEVLAKVVARSQKPTSVARQLLELDLRPRPNRQS